MNKKFALLAFLLLLVPACKKKTHYAPAPATCTTPTVAPETAVFDEELGAFVVKDDENKFSTAGAANQEEELSAATNEQTTGDINTDSARYGIKNIYFEFNKYKMADLRPEQVSALKHNSEIVKSLANKGYKISIEGHACNSAGSTEYNMMLSEDRARAVADYLRENGVVGDIYTIGHGSANLVVTSGTREQQAPNRRVEIYAYPATDSATVA